jgi:dipeptidyl aminopeptidase/acylaminoacyl peptidase
MKYRECVASGFLLAVVTACVLLPAASAQSDKSRAAAIAQKYPPLPEDVLRKQVIIWSDGTRMAGDVYVPKGLKPRERLPAIVFAHGTGGVKKMAWSIRLAVAFARRGYVFLNFDYRGWGESESKLMMLEEMPPPDANSEVTVKARAIRWQMDFGDQITDIRNAIAFVSGEPNVDYHRVGVFGTSYGGGLATWIAAEDPRVKCAVAQVPGMGGQRTHGTYRHAYTLMAQQARGEAEPIPFKSGAPGGTMASYSHMRYNPAKNIVYDVFQAAEKLTVPIYIIDAGKEELMDITQQGGRVAEILKRNGTPHKYEVIEGMGHYGIYGKYQEQITKAELDWFDKHLKN